MVFGRAELKVGDRVKIHGGYEMEPRWLCGKAARSGTVRSLIPGQNEEEAAVVKLDAPIVVDGYEGDIVVLELRYVGAKWKKHETVNIELCNFEIEPKAWSQRPKGKRVESHGSYDRI